MMTRPMPSVNDIIGSIVESGRECEVEERFSRHVRERFFFSDVFCTPAVVKFSLA